MGVLRRAIVGSYKQPNDHAFSSLLAKARALRSGMIDPVQFPQPTLLAKYPGAELWEVSRRK